MELLQTAELATFQKKKKYVRLDVLHMFFCSNCFSFENSGIPSLLLLNLPVMSGTVSMTVAVPLLSVVQQSNVLSTEFWSQVVLFTV